MYFSQYVAKAPMIPDALTIIALFCICSAAYMTPVVMLYVWMRNWIRRKRK